MKAVKIAKRSELPRRLNALLELVRKGESVLIVDKDQPIARLEPPNAAKNEDEEERMARLERAGLVRRGRGGPVESILRGERVKPRKPVDLAALLRDERDGR